MKRAAAASALDAVAAASSLAPLPIVPLRRDDLPVESAALARFMVGKYLVHELPGKRLVGRLVEIEGYPPGDSTGHAFIGPRAWNASLFLARGYAYVRLTYGVSYMLNMSSEREGVGAGVLFRAVEPLEGVECMAARRPGAPLRDLTRGPGKLTQAFGVGASFDGVDLCAGVGLWIGQMANDAPPNVGVTTRIGLSREQDRLLRFYEIGNPFVSGPRKLLANV